MKFIDLFAGIGGFRMGMELAGHECVGFCEIDEHAVRSYRAIFNTEGEFYANDIRSVDPGELPKFDCITAGFPCQSFSIAGKRGGFEDTRGTLFFEIARIVRERQPKIVLLENVKGLLSHDGGSTFGTILRTLGELGYWWEYQILNSKDFGVPQNRERVFIIGHLRGSSRGAIFPITRENRSTLRQIIGGMQGYRVYDPDGVSCTLASQAGGMGAKTGLYAVGYNRNDGIKKEIDIAYTLGESDYRGLNRNQDQTAVAVPIISKDGKLKESNTNEQYASTLTAGGNSGGNHSDMDLLVMEDEPKAAFINQPQYGEYKLGDTADTLTSEGKSSKQQVIIGAIRGRNPDNPSDRTAGIPTEQRFEESSNGIANSLTTVQKDNVLAIKDIGVLRPKRTDYGKAIRKEYEAGEIKESRHNMTQLEPVFDGISNTVTTVQKDNLLFVGGVGDFDRVGDGKELSRNFTQGNRIYDSEGIAATLQAEPVGGAGGSSSLYKVVEPVSNFPELKPKEKFGLPVANYRIRRLTPKECWRLQGFPDSAFEKARAVNSDTQLYRQAGNSVTVNVIYEIARRFDLENAE